MMYRQCVFKSENLYTTAWIKETGAEVGKVVKFKDSDDAQRHWTVISVGSGCMDERVANAASRRGNNFVKGPQEWRTKLKGLGNN